MPQQTSHETLAPNTMLDNGRYRVQEVIGSGGYASVYKAIDLQYGYERAIKEVVAPDEGVAKQFRLEADVLVNIQSPNVPRGYNVFTQNRRIYFVMDFVEGKDLEELLNDSLIQRRRALDEAQVLQWMIAIAGALSKLHTMPTPIIHRDIKPANIKITPQGLPVLIDFGLAKLQEATKQTQTAAQGVSPGFAPPEQYMAKGRTDARTDIYGLGATLYACLTGKDPAEAPARLLAQTGVNHGGAALEPPSKINPHISSRTEQVILRALELAPARRQQTAKEMADDLRAALAALTGQPALAPTQVMPPTAAAAAKVDQQSGKQKAVKPAARAAAKAPAAPAAARPAPQIPGSGVMAQVVAAAAPIAGPQATAKAPVPPLTSGGPATPAAAKPGQRTAQQPVIASSVATVAPQTSKQPVAAAPAPIAAPTPDAQRRTLLKSHQEAAARSSGKHPAVQPQPLVGLSSSQHPVLEAQNSSARVLAAGAIGAAGVGAAAGIGAANSPSAKRPAVQAPPAAQVAKPAATTTTQSAWISLGKTPLSPFGKIMLALASLETIWGVAALSFGVIALATHGILGTSLLVKLGIGWLVVVLLGALLGGQALSRPVLRRGALNGLRRGFQGTALFLYALAVHAVALWGAAIFAGAHGDATAEVIAYTIFGVNVLVAGVFSLLTVLG